MKRFCLALFCCLALLQAATAQTSRVSTPPAAAVETPSLDALRVRLQSLETRLAKQQIPADPQNLALLKFKMEQAQLWIQKMESNAAPSILSTPYDETKTYIQQAIERAESVARARGDAVYPATTQLHERAYIAANDGSVQPYWIFVPRDYSPRQKWPLVVFLHGYSPSISKIEPWIPGEETWEPFTSRGFILAVPYGRRNSDFVNIGEDDTLTVTSAVSTRYNVDSERTFLLGPSMGGFGVFAVGLHNPDRFAAIAPMCARTDMYLWFNLDRDAVPAWKRVLYDGDDPRRLVKNARHLPMFFQHGSDDHIVSVEHSRRLVADLRPLNFPAFYREIPGASHFIYWDDRTYEIALDWLKKIRRAPAPIRVEYSTGSLRTNRAYWAAIEGFEKYDRLARIDAQIKAGNVIEVSTENVSRFTLNPPRDYLAVNKPITLLVNGVEEKETYDAAQSIHWPRATEAPALHKTPQRTGPIKECYRDPFLLVYGTLGAGADDEANARRFRREWDLYADGKPPIKADKDVTIEDKKNYNLILFGTRETNSLLAPIAARLPVELKVGGYRLGDKEYSVPGQNFGVQLCYPSPYDEKRMIVVQSGHFWGDALDINHKFDLLPEYIVYSDETDATDKTNRALAAGFFDDNWQLPPDAAPLPQPTLETAVNAPEVAEQPQPKGDVETVGTLP